jgi:hypothetical protein
MRLTDGQVSVVDSVAAPHKLSGRALRDSYLPGITALTLGLIRWRDTSLTVGPWELFRFGSPRITRTAAEWPIEGGLLARTPGGAWRLESSGGRLTASVQGYRPLLPAPVYVATQLQAHHLLTRLFLLRLRGREPAPGVTATSSDRMRAAAVDVAVVATLASLGGRRPRLRAVLGIVIAYHVACWSISGRTLGGVVMRQRVVAVDGSRLSVTQALVRAAVLPLSWIRGRPDHDEIACTEVVTVEP